MDGHAPDGGVAALWLFLAAGVLTAFARRSQTSAQLAAARQVPAPTAGRVAER